MPAISSASRLSVLLRSWLVRRELRRRGVGGVTWSRHVVFADQVDIDVKGVLMLGCPLDPARICAGMAGKAQKVRSPGLDPRDKDPIGPRCQNSHRGTGERSSRSVPHFCVSGPFSVDAAALLGFVS